MKSIIHATGYKENIIVVVVVVVVNFIKHQNRAITGERVAARAAPSITGYRLDNIVTLYFMYFNKYIQSIICHFLSEVL